MCGFMLVCMHGHKVVSGTCSYKWRCAGLSTVKGVGLAAQNQICKQKWVWLVNIFILVQCYSLLAANQN